MLLKLVHFYFLKALYLSYGSRGDLSVKFRLWSFCRTQDPKERVIRDTTPISIASNDSKTLFLGLMINRFPHSLIFQKKIHCTKNEVFHKDFFSKCDQIRWKLRIWSHLRKKSLMENFIFCAVIETKRKQYLPLGKHFTQSVKYILNLDILGFS